MDQGVLISEMLKVKTHLYSGVYDATKHPDVIQGKRTEDDILREFLSTF